MGSFSLMVLAWSLVCVTSRQPDSMALLQFLVCGGFMMLCSLSVIWRYHCLGQQIAFRWIFFSALLLRLISLLGDPLFEDDYFRYLWDGFQTATTLDPYSHAPAVFFDRDVPEIFEPVLSLINYPDVATVYGPVLQWIFALGYMIEPAKVWPLQLMAGMADMSVLWILFRLGGGNSLLLYAWSPLLLKEFSLTAHPDIYAILFMMVSIYAVHRHRAVVGGMALALACGLKVFAILVLPYLLTRGWSLRSWINFGLGFVTSIVAITASFGTLAVWMPEGLKAMADSWFFNAPLYLLLLPLFQFQTIKVLLLGLFLLFGMVVCCRRLLRVFEPEEPLSSSLRWSQARAAFRGDYLYAAFLLSLPVLNPWYVAWLLPFAVLYPRWWSWTASYAVLLSYWYGNNISNAGAEQLKASVIAIEFGFIIVVTVLAAAVKMCAVRFRDAA